MRFCLYITGPFESRFISIARIRNMGEMRTRVIAEIMMSHTRLILIVLSLISALDTSIRGSPTTFDTRAFAVIK